MALAAALSGLWGVYDGFELCEGATVPDREKYLDSKKYRLRAWDYSRSGNIVKKITLLNRIRRANLALHSHPDVTFQPAPGDRILFFNESTSPVLPAQLKTAPAELAESANVLSPDRFEDNTMFVAINFDPHHAYEPDIELSPWQWDLSDHGVLMVENLVNG